MDFREINGQEGAKRAAQIAAAGMHNLLMIGSPGAGKTMIARRMPTILPGLTMQKVWRLPGYTAHAALLEEEGLVKTRPFRAPHHTISANALAGGGRYIQPGEVSLATRGILFLTSCLNFPAGHWRLCVSLWKRE